MVDERAQDLVGLDRDVALAATGLARWRSALAADPEGHADEDALEDVRRVASKSMWDALGELPEGGADGLLRDALRRWVAWLVQARIGRADDVARARAAAAPVGEYAGDRTRHVSWREAWRGVASAKTPAGARLWLSASAGPGPGLADAPRAPAARPLHLARPTGLPPPSA